MIYTLTLNPALDYDMYLDEDLKLEHLNLAKEVNFRAGGKGINVSKVLKNLQSKSKSTNPSNEYASLANRREWLFAIPP